MPENVRFEDGVLRMRRSHLLTAAALWDGATSEELDEEDLADLREAELVVDSKVHPELEAIAATVRHPVVTLGLDLRSQRQRAGCTGWVAGLSVLAVPNADGFDDIKVASTSFLPIRLAEFVGLGPRRAAPTDSSADFAAFERHLMDLTRQDSTEEGHARDEPDVSRELAVSLRVHWTVTAAWRNGRRTVEVIDAGDQGLWAVTRDEGKAAKLHPTTASAIWRDLVALLPTDADLEDTTLEARD